MTKAVDILNHARIMLRNQHQRGFAGMGDASQANLAAYNWAVYLSALAQADPAAYQYLSAAKAYQDISAGAKAHPGEAYKIITQYVASGPTAMQAAADLHLAQEVQRAGEYSEAKRAAQDTIQYKLKRGQERIGELIKKNPLNIIPSEKWWAAADSKAAAVIEPLEKIVQTVAPVVMNAVAPGSGAIFSAVASGARTLEGALNKPEAAPATQYDPLRVQQQEAAAIQSYNLAAAKEAAGRAGGIAPVPVATTTQGAPQPSALSDPKTQLLIGGAILAGVYFYTKGGKGKTRGKKARKRK